MESSLSSKETDIPYLFDDPFTDEKVFLLKAGLKMGLIDRKLIENEMFPQALIYRYSRYPSISNDWWELLKDFIDTNPVFERIFNESVKESISPFLFRMLYFHYPRQITNVFDDVNRLLFSDAMKKVKINTSRFDPFIMKFNKCYLGHSPKYHERQDFLFFQLKELFLLYPVIMIVYIETIAKGILQKRNQFSDDDESVYILGFYTKVLGLIKCLCCNGVMFKIDEDLFRRLIEEFYFLLFNNLVRYHSEMENIVKYVNELLISYFQFNEKNASAWLTKKKTTLSRIRKLFPAVSNFRRLFTLLKMDDFGFLFARKEEKSGIENIEVYIESKNTNPAYVEENHEKVFKWLSQIANSKKRVLENLQFIMSLLKTRNKHVREMSYTIILKCLRENFKEKQLSSAVVQSYLGVFNCSDEGIRNHAIKFSCMFAPFVGERIEKLCEILFLIQVESSIEQLKRICHYLM